MIKWIITTIILAVGVFGFIYFSTLPKNTPLDIVPQPNIQNNNVVTENKTVSNSVKETPKTNVVTPTSQIKVAIPAKIPAPASPTSPPTSNLASSKIDSCRTINTSGKYSLESDLIVPQNDSCIKIQNVGNVSLDCQNHTITKIGQVGANISIKGVSDFKFYNCKLASESSLPAPIIIDNSQRGEIYNNTRIDYLSISSSNTITIYDNKMTGVLRVDNSNKIIIKNNNFFNIKPNEAKPSLIYLGDGHSNSVVSNIIDGNSSSIFPSDLSNTVGVDDGVIIENESQDTIQDNTIQNVWDCGVENTHSMFDSKIIGNTIKNTGYCGIGGWYWSSVKGNLIKDNIGDNIPRLFVFFRQYALAKGETQVYFKDNIFENNKFVNPRASSGDNYMETSSFAIQAGDVPNSSIVTGNNIFKNNDFTTIAKPIIFTPASMIIDGGGNRCTSSAEQNYPINCNN